MQQRLYWSCNWSRLIEICKMQTSDNLIDWTSIICDKHASTYWNPISFLVKMNIFSKLNINKVSINCTILMFLHDIIGSHPILEYNLVRAHRKYSPIWGKWKTLDILEWIRHMCQTPNHLINHHYTSITKLEGATAWEPWAMFPYILCPWALLYGWHWLPWVVFSRRLTTKFPTPGDQ